MTFNNNKDKEINGKLNNYIPTLQYLLNIFNPQSYLLIINSFKFISHHYLIPRTALQLINQ